MTEINGTNTGLTFKVTRQAPELICPTSPTPYESKELSDLDNSKDVRYLVPLIMFYRNPTSNINLYLRGSDPVKVIKDTIAKALVWYYPLAGRLRETSEGKLGVELVTRLKCGGFILALRQNHTMTDGIGLVQFLNAVIELASGAQRPSISPVWMRHLLINSPGPSQGSGPDVSYEFNRIAFPLGDLVHKSFFFGSTEMASLQQSIPPSTTTFELIIAHLWRCHTMALYKNPQETVQLRFAMNTRSKYNPSLPAGYYGNVAALPTAQATTAEISENPFQYTVDLVKRTKENVNVNEEYLKSLANRMAEAVSRLTVSDHRRIGFNCLDFGWGRPVYGGFARGSAFGRYLGYATCFAPFKHPGKSGALVPICLPRSAMKKFVKLISLV